MNIYDKLLSRWGRKAESLASSDPEWAAIQARRGTDGNLVLSDDLTWEDWERQREIEDALYPMPRHLRIIRHLMPSRHAAHPLNWRKSVTNRWERSQKGWAPSDVWNLDSYLASVIETSTLRLRDSTHSYPGDMTPEQWSGILTEIAEGFAASQEMGNADTPEEETLLAAKYERGFDLFREWFHHLWD